MFGAFAQTNSTFIRQDTILLKSAECNWLISPVYKKNNMMSNTPGNTLSEWLLQSVKNGKLKAFDPYTGKQIPAKQIYSWNMPVDTVTYADVDSGATKYRVVHANLDPDNIKQIRVQQDWYLNYNNGEIFSRIGWIELMTDVYSSFGGFMGTKPFCRIYY